MPDHAPSVVHKAPVPRRIADLLTASRILLSLILIWIGWTRGAEGLPAAIVTLLLAWLTDILDGPIARLSPGAPVSFWGRREDIADMSMSLGVIGYLVTSHRMTLLYGLLLGGLIAGVWLYRYPLAWPLYVIPYVILASNAFTSAPLFGWLMIAYVAIVLIFRLPRLLHEYLPLFIDAVRRLK